MGLIGILSKSRKKETAAGRIKKILEADLERLIWEMNFRLLCQQGLQERILWVEAAKVIQVSVHEEKQTLPEKIKNLCSGLFGRIRKGHNCNKKYKERKVDKYGSNSRSV